MPGLKPAKKYHSSTDGREFSDAGSRNGYDAQIDAGRIPYAEAD